MNSKTLTLKDWLPPALIPMLRKFAGKGIRFDGDYSTWEAAAALCAGYDNELIFRKVLDATLKVKRGEAAFERDSVVFDEIKYSWPVTAALMWVAARNDGVLNVLDFGGSLGSSYFQNRRFLSRLKLFSWAVVEQSGFVNIGNQYISDQTLSFYTDIDDCCVNRAPNVALVSSVLQYIKEPFAILEKIAENKIELIVIDRTPFSNDSIQKIKIQNVPSNIYKASYPCWFFSREEVIQRMQVLNYEVIECFDAIDKLSNEATWQGLIFEKVNRE